MPGSPEIPFHFDDADLFNQKAGELLKKLKAANQTLSEQELRDIAEEMAIRSFFQNKEAERPH